MSSVFNPGWLLVSHSCFFSCMCIHRHWHLLIFVWSSIVFTCQSFHFQWSAVAFYWTAANVSAVTHTRLRWQFGQVGTTFSTQSECIIVTLFVGLTWQTPFVYMGEFLITVFSNHCQQIRSDSRTQLSVFLRDECLPPRALRKINYLWPQLSSRNPAAFH